MDGFKYNKEELCYVENHEGRQPVRRKHVRLR